MVNGRVANRSSDHLRGVRINTFLLKTVPESGSDEGWSEAGRNGIDSDLVSFCHGLTGPEEADNAVFRGDIRNIPRCAKVP